MLSAYPTDNGGLHTPEEVEEKPSFLHAGAACEHSFKVGFVLEHSVASGRPPPRLEVVLRAPLPWPEEWPMFPSPVSVTLASSWIPHVVLVAHWDPVVLRGRQRQRWLATTGDLCQPHSAREAALASAQSRMLPS